MYLVSAECIVYCLSFQLEWFVFSDTFDTTCLGHREKLEVWYFLFVVALVQSQFEMF